MFLLAKRGPARDLYDFRPYNWGPYSSRINRDVDELERDGLITSTPVPGQTWSRYSVTPRESVARDLAEDVDPDDVAWLAKAKRFVMRHSFATLLRKIYEHYPEYATKSLLR